MITRIKNFHDIAAIKPGDMLLWAYTEGSEISMIDRLSRNYIQWIYMVEVVLGEVNGNAEEFGYERMEFHLSEPYRPGAVKGMRLQVAGYAASVNFSRFNVTRFETMDELTDLLPAYVVIHNHNLLIEFWRFWKEEPWKPVPEFEN